MANVILERRVDDLRDMMGDILRSIADMHEQQRRTDEQLLRSQEQQQELRIEVTRLSREMLDFKNEMREFKNEMLDFKDEMREFKNEMLEFKDEMLDFKNEMREFKGEMLDFKNEMREFKDEMSESHRQARREWGELANKMGTMAEDLVAPSVPRILRTIIGNGDPEDMAVRVRRHHPETGRRREFDVVARCGEYVLINETKSSLEPKDIRKFVKVLCGARDYFPEYADKKFIGAIASLYVDPSLVHYGERLGLIVLGFGEDVMDVLNSPGFKPRTF